uniref:C2H2-type domain-containing protein n=1 Tax=Nelumbo nucifera TaxID=4432 RepID=A0A822YGB8_NELNU|nr:TPA_asm: hypothetical protein HUJ06_031484 [Nelumbo nucifera]
MERVIYVTIPIRIRISNPNDHFSPQTQLLPSSPDQLNNATEFRTNPASFPTLPLPTSLHHLGPTDHILLQDPIDLNLNQLQGVELMRTDLRNNHFPASLPIHVHLRNHIPSLNQPSSSLPGQLRPSGLLWNNPDSTPSQIGIGSPNLQRQIGSTESRMNQVGEYRPTDSRINQVVIHGTPIRFNIHWQGHLGPHSHKAQPVAQAELRSNPVLSPNPIGVRFPDPEKLPSMNQLHAASKTKGIPLRSPNDHIPSPIRRRRRRSYSLLNPPRITTDEVLDAIPRRSRFPDLNLTPLENQLGLELDERRHEPHTTTAPGGSNVNDGRTPHGPYTCSICREVFPTSQSVAGHSRRHYVGGKKELGRVIRRPTGFNSHLLRLLSSNSSSEPMVSTSDFWFGGPSRLIEEESFLQAPAGGSSSSYSTPSDNAVTDHVSHDAEEANPNAEMRAERPTHRVEIIEIDDEDDEVPSEDAVTDQESHNADTSAEVNPNEEMKGKQPIDEMDEDKAYIGNSSPSYDVATDQESRSADMAKEKINPNSEMKAKQPTSGIETEINEEMDEDKAADVGSTSSLSQDAVTDEEPRNNADMAVEKASPNAERKAKKPILRVEINDEMDEDEADAGSSSTPLQDVVIDEEPHNADMVAEKVNPNAELLKAN